MCLLFQSKPFFPPGIFFAEMIEAKAVKWPSISIQNLSVHFPFVLQLLFLWSSYCCYVFFPLSLPEHDWLGQPAHSGSME